MKIRVHSGDITKVEVDGLITAINSEGAWFGGIDMAIQRAAGNAYHNQIHPLQDLRDGVAYIAQGWYNPDNAKFHNVVFVVDDLRKPLGDILLAGLVAADDEGYKTVSIPTIRMGVMAGARENKVEAIAAIASTLLEFSGTAKNLEEAVVVVYNDPATADLIQNELDGGKNGNDGQ